MKVLLVITALLLIAGNTFAQSHSKEVYDVYALEYADSKGPAPISHVAIGATSNDSVDFAYYFWYLKGDNGRKILVDTGFREASTTPKLSLRSYQRPDSVLERLGVTPNEITDVVITHPHFDHIDGLALFPKATVWMQKKDYDYFVGEAWQKGGDNYGFTPEDVRNIVNVNLEGRLRLVDGDSIEIIPGIRVFIGSRHTWESQHLLVNAHGEKVMVASDDDWFYYNLHHLLPIPLTFDKVAYVQQLRRMKTLVSDTTLIIPGHDGLVLHKFPVVAKDIVRIR
jgi:glyoxylase-like metal-dependent hydrolase (beta-lactamase superfamily II)